MPTGETNSIDFNFEDLQFIDGDIENLANEPDPNQDPKKDEGSTQGKTEDPNIAKLEADEKEAAQKIKDNEDAAEKLKASERVSGTADGKKDGEESSPQLYHTLANVLKEQGVFSSVDESSLKDVNDVKTFVDAIKQQIKAEEFTDLTEQQKIVLNDMRAGVKETTASKFKGAMDNLDNVTDKTIDDNKQARFDLIYQDFLSKGFEAEKAERYANRSFDLKEDQKDALEARDSLKRVVKEQYDKAKQGELDAATKIKDGIAADKDKLRDVVLKSPEVMDGVEVNEGLRHEIFDVINNMVSSNPETGVPENSLQKHQRENPVDYNHKLYYLYKVTDGFKNLDYFGRRTKSSSVKDLENALRQSTHISGGGNPSYSDDGNSQILDIGNLVLPGE